MKLWIKLLTLGIGSFGAGFAAGYFVRKKTCEVKLEEVSEEDLNKIIAEAQNSPSEPSDEADKGNVPANDETSKEAYFKRWQEEKEAASKYDTRSKETPENPEITKTEDEKITKFLKEDLKEIEPASIDDWHQWLNLMPDGEYDAVELYWYPADDVVCDEFNVPLEDTERFIGFDIAEQFKKIDPETTGDPDVRVVYNHKHHSIFYITRRNSSYNVVKRMEEYGNDNDDEDDESGE